jgi:hypothetical protein
MDFAGESVWVAGNNFDVITYVGLMKVYSNYPHSSERPTSGNKSCLRITRKQ